MTTVILESGGVTAEAELLTDNAPNAVRAFLEMLPLTKKLISAKWSGDVALIHPGAGALNDVVDLENPVTSIYPGTMVLRPRGSELLISYGVAEYRWGPGTDYLTRLGKITKNRREFLEVLRQTAEHGPSTLTITAA